MNIINKKCCQTYGTSHVGIGLIKLIIISLIIWN